MRLDDDDDDDAMRLALARYVRSYGATFTLLRFDRAARRSLKIARARLTRISSLLTES